MGQEGHSIIAEIAQVRLRPYAGEVVRQLLKGRSLASVASWADDIRKNRPDTSNWHFVDIPINADSYDEKRDCKPTEKGDCVVRELIRLRNDLRCADGVKQVEALKFAVHFIGDIHQPLHIVLEAKGGNDIPVRLVMHGRRECSGKCDPIPSTSSFHEAWDSGLIHQTVWDWGDYVDQLEKGWLSTEEAHKPNIDGGTPEEWANQTHKAAQEVWTLLPSEAPLDDAYYKKIEPILDRQLGLGGLRLARFLNDAFVSNVCPVQ